MSAVFSFQTQLVSIMDALSKTAVMEISKLVEIESKMLKIEITRGRNEIASLTEKLQLMEKLLYIAQGGRQDAAAAASSGVRDCSEDGILEPDRTRPAIKSESPWECITSSTEKSSLHQGEERAAAEVPSPPQEQPELIVVKEEPPEFYNGDTEQDRTREDRREEVTDSQKSPEVMQHPKRVAVRQQPLFTDSFVALSTQSSLSGPVRQETQWNPQLPPAHTNVDAGKSLVQNVASQSLSVLKIMKLHNLRNSAAKRFGCLQCGKSFRCFSQLEIHQRSHTGEKPFRSRAAWSHLGTKDGHSERTSHILGKQPCKSPSCNLIPTYRGQQRAARAAGLWSAGNPEKQEEGGRAVFPLSPFWHRLTSRLIKERLRCAGTLATNLQTSSLPVEMMCDTTNRSFRTQLAAVLEKLTKAALVEIANLADQCTSVLHTEISLHKTENEALKKKCYSLEVQLRAAREAHTYPGLVSCAGRRLPAGQDEHKHDRGSFPGCLTGGTVEQQQAAPAIDGVFGKDWCMDLWREEKLPPQRKDTVEPPAMTSMGAQASDSFTCRFLFFSRAVISSASRDDWMIVVFKAVCHMSRWQAMDMMEREPDLIFVKEETYDDLPIGLQMRLTDNRKMVGMFEEDSMLHRSVDELQLHPGDLNNFPMTVDSQPTTAPTPEYSDYTDSIHMNATKDIVQPKPVKPTKRFECLFCGKIFNYLSSLKVHIRRHS
ncbi:hypothetical protein L3Q82_014096, partial [Scortum barcoo]